MASDSEWNIAVHPRRVKRAIRKERQASEAERVQPIQEAFEELRRQYKVVKAQPMPHALRPLCDACAMAWNQYGEVYNPANDPDGCLCTLSATQQADHQVWQAARSAAFDAMRAFYDTHKQDLVLKGGEAALYA
jgi:hypothetical protein